MMLGRAVGGRLVSAASALTSQAIRPITSKALRKEDPDRCPPWPYRERGFNYRTDFWLDHPEKRLDENSKLIVVEGNIGSGKSTLAKELADALGFYYMPEFSMDDILINSYGVDRRKFYHNLPASTAIPDVKMFYDDPYNPYNAQMQKHMAIGKWENHLNACAHIINTGQGVVMERSFHSDFVFVNACREKNIYSYDFFRWYHAMRKYCLPVLHFWPHLVIYLDAPVEDCLKRIQKRGIPGENNGKVIDAQYLDTIRQSYTDLMKDYKKHSRMLIYDWKTAADPERVVEDVERMDLDYYEWHDGDMLEEWNTMWDGWEWNYYRNYVTNKREHMDCFEAIPTYEVDELNPHPEEYEQFLACMKVNVFGPYAVGFNPDKHSFADIALTDKGIRGWELERLGKIRWYDHYYRDVWFGAEHSLISAFDKSGKEFYNPYYGDHHH